MAVTFVIDISHHQDKALDLARTRRDGCEACFIKAGEGSNFVDSEFSSNLAEARAAGQLVAAYWYQRSNASAGAHVALIQRTVPKDVPIILDVEANSGGIGLTRQLVDALRAAGYAVPLLYLPRWYWQQIGSPSLVGLPPLWSSRYPNNLVGLLANEWAEVPASFWSGYGGLSVAILQFTSSARIAGFAPLDASAFRGTRDELAAMLNQEDDMPSSEEIFNTVWRTPILRPDPKDAPDWTLDGAQVLDIMRSTAAQVDQLVQLLAAGHSVSADEIAAALQPGLVSAVLPSVREAVHDALGEDNAAQADEVASAVLAKLGAKLAPAAEEVAA